MDKKEYSNPSSLFDSLEEYQNYIDTLAQRLQTGEHFQIECSLKDVQSLKDVCKLAILMTGKDITTGKVSLKVID